MNTEAHRLTDSAIVREQRDRAAGLISQAENIIITDKAQSIKASEFIIEAKRLLDAIEEHRKRAKKPILDEGRAIDAAFKEMTSPLNLALQSVRDKIASFAKQLREDEEKRRKEQERAVKEIADKAEKRGDIAAADRVRARGAELTKEVKRELVESDTASMSSRTVAHSIEIVNFNTVPRQFLMLDRRKVLATANALLKQKRPMHEVTDCISGLKITCRESVSIRKRY